jgi:Uri superfamily endonuclease
VKGIYVLVISVNNKVKIHVGALGTVSFEKGLYAYVGSAQKGLEKRIARHLRKSKRRFWHIDYLLGADNVEVLKVFHKEAPKLGECRVARNMAIKGIPVKGFGSSDCRCKSHLFKVEGCQFLGGFMREIAL